jgi:hypothetical protein
MTMLSDMDMMPGEEDAVQYIQYQYFGTDANQNERASSRNHEIRIRITLTLINGHIDIHRKNCIGGHPSPSYESPNYSDLYLHLYGKQGRE